MEAKTIYRERPWLKFYAEGVPRDIDIIHDKSIPDRLDEAAEKWKGNTALIFYGKRTSFRDLKEQVDRLATAAAHLGVKKGDRVALYLLNSPAFVIAYFGFLKAGAIITPISPVYVSREIKHQIEDSGAETIVCQDILYGHLERADVKLKNVILTSIGDFLPPLKKFLGKSILRVQYKGMEAPSSQMFEREGFYRFQDLLKYPPNPPEIKFDPEEDLAVISYTGGTTGLPKGAMLSHYNLVNAEVQNNTLLAFLEEGKEIQLCYMPLYHIFGQVGLMLNGLLRGFILIIFTTPDIDDILSTVESEKVTLFWGAPGLYNTLKDHDKTDRVNWKRLKYIVCAADILHEETANGWERRTGVKLHEAYGSTEAPAGTFSPLGRPKHGSFGVPTPSTEMAIINPEVTTQFLPPGEIGELVIKGPQIMKGYWGHPEETGEVLVEIEGEKWFRSGDLVWMDEEGYFYFHDRKRDRIKYKGYSVFPAEIEEVLANHPKIKEVAVIGVPDVKVGEIIKACIVLKRDARGKLSEGDIIKYCEDKLAHYKVPRIVEFRGEIPKTDAGKVSRRELREEEMV